MWLWFNKTVIDSNKSILDVENFRRGLKVHIYSIMRHRTINVNMIINCDGLLQGDTKELKDKGEVLWRAAFTDRPQFQYQQRLVGQQHNFNPFVRLCNDPYTPHNDDFYINHNRHGRGSGDRKVGTIITNWCLNTGAAIS